MICLRPQRTSVWRNWDLNLGSLAPKPAVITPLPYSPRLAVDLWEMLLLSPSLVSSLLGSSAEGLTLFHL